MTARGYKNRTKRSILFKWEGAEYKLRKAMDNNSKSCRGETDAGATVGMLESKERVR